MLMKMRSITREKHDLLLQLRREGMSIPEISAYSGIAKTTVQRHVKGIVVPETFLKRLREKQGGAKKRAKGMRENCLEEAGTLLGKLSSRDFLMIVIGLYWGEGTKRDFSLINSDPKLLQTFMVCLEKIGISKNRISLSLRVHSDISISESKTFWANTLRMPRDEIRRVEVIQGRKKGKLKYGMCRIRISSGIRDRLLIQSAISLIGKEASERVLSA